MIRPFINNKKLITYSIPTQWSDVSYKRWKEMQKAENNLEVVASLSGIESIVINRMDEKAKKNVCYFCEFVEKPVKESEYKAPDKLILSNGVEIPFIKDIKKGTFGQKITLTNIIRANKTTIYDCMVDIILVYAQPLIDGSTLKRNRFEELSPLFDDISFVYLYSTAVNYLEQLKVILEVESTNLAKDPNPDHQQAGIEMFDKFGIMNTIKAMAKGDPLKYEAVLNLQYGIVYRAMHMNKTQSDFDDNYRQVLKRKHK